MGNWESLVKCGTLGKLGESLGNARSLQEVLAIVQKYENIYWKVKGDCVKSANLWPQHSM